MCIPMLNETALQAACWHMRGGAVPRIAICLRLWHRPGLPPNGARLLPEFLQARCGSCPVCHTKLQCLLRLLSVGAHDQLLPRSRLTQ